ncbi:hypothetical protein [Lichenihabitans psoromatis]|uniref:hypothetical protein n=1 Tax=Lichenihabitans psoromatis TaxID=2528642 RepID=UPI001038532B|nr:hypothetical protein [Lichenihabitans psoromatis]
MQNTSTANHGRPSEDVCPISDALFAQICRSTPSQSRELSLGFSAQERARLALFCNSRAHLRESGREIAGTCTEASLTREGGQAGLVLFQQARSGPETWGLAPRQNSRRVSLAG